MIILDKVSFRYNEKLETSFKLKEVSFSCPKGSITGVIGGNGSGKSTVARLIAGMIEPQTGIVTVDGFAPFNHTGCCGFLAGIIFQTPDNQIVGTTVAEDLAFGLENLGVSYDEMQVRVRETASRFGLGDMLATPVHYLSGGQKQLLCIASVMIMQPSWMLFFEPTSHLDPWARDSFWHTVKTFAREHDIGVMVVSQLAEDLQHFEQILAFNGGSLVFNGPIAKLRANVEQLPWFRIPDAWKLEKILEARP